VRDWIGQQHGELSGELVASTATRPLGPHRRPAGLSADVADAVGAVRGHRRPQVRPAGADRYDAVAYKTLWRSKLGIKVLSASEPSRQRRSAGMLSRAS